MREAAEKIQYHTPENNRHSYELPRSKIERLGHIAINNLGINDPLADIAYYLNHTNKEKALNDILINFETNVAEYLKETPFINRVQFNFTGNDFLSDKEGISMREMATTSLRIFKNMKDGSKIMFNELVRANLESQETDKLSKWFIDAPIGGYLIFESLPLENQTIAIPRIYQKISNNSIEGTFVSLHNPEVEHFNKLRTTLGSGNASNKNALEVLSNHYDFYDPDLTNSDDFTRFYVNSYDKILGYKHSSNFYFGLDTSTTQIKQNGIEKVRQLPNATALYTELVQIIAQCNGAVTQELTDFAKDIRIEIPTQDSTLNAHSIRDILDQTMKVVVAFVDIADDKALNDFKNLDLKADRKKITSTMSGYGQIATSEGKEYTSNGCPKYGLKESDNNGEQSAINKAFNLDNLPDNFGEASFDICRISNCPTRGKSKWWPKKTMVGGCKICVNCHNHFSKGKNPKEIYKKQIILKRHIADLSIKAAKNNNQTSLSPTILPIKTVENNDSSTVLSLAA